MAPMILGLAFMLLVSSVGVVDVLVVQPRARMRRPTAESKGVKDEPLALRASAGVSRNGPCGAQEARYSVAGHLLALGVLVLATALLALWGLALLALAVLR